MTPEQVLTSIPQPSLQQEPLENPVAVSGQHSQPDKRNTNKVTINKRIIPSLPTIKTIF